MFPADVAYPVGGSGPRYLVMETHYDNPMEASSQYKKQVSLASLGNVYTLSQIQYRIWFENFVIAVTKLHVI